MKLLPVSQFCPLRHRFDYRHGRLFQQKAEICDLVWELHESPLSRLLAMASKRRKRVI